MNRMLFFTGCVLAGTSARAQDTPPRLEPVPFTKVRIEDAFWAPRRETNRTVSIPHSLDMLEKSGTIGNFDLAAAGERKGYRGPVFMDSDAYKTLEAAAYTLATDPDPGLDRRLDGIIAKIAAAQMKDGYLNTWYQVNAPDKRWTNLRNNHELYCAGHLFEAAAAHFLATGKRNLLDVAVRFADHIDSVFGPGKRMGYPGHPEIELALVRLWRATGERRYFDLARFFVEHRGTAFFAKEHGTPLDRYDGTYWQDNAPIREHRFIGGHAVRAAYLFSGVADVASETGDAGLLAMMDRVWRNTTQKRMYLTGGIGPSAHNEGFTEDYDLPNESAYQETCASIALAMWNHRLALLTGDARYADLVERSLYNAALDGVSLDGRRFFYVNPLASAGTHHRRDWFGCACCPPNVARTLASLGGYAYAASERGFWVNLYVQGSAEAKVGGAEVSLRVRTEYPWDGGVKLTLETDAAVRFALHLRVPGWCAGASVKVNGAAAADPCIERGYLVLEREWKAGDAVDLDLPMPVVRIESHPRVKADEGRAAVMRGPLVYCFEGVDHESPVSSIAVPPETELKPEKRPDLLGGVVVLKGTGLAAEEVDWKGRLYCPMAPPRRVPVTAIPYYAWDNREAGEMRVWMPLVPPPSTAGGLEARAQVSVSFKNANSNPEAIRDGKEPKSSGEHPGALCHWWPHKGDEEWAQYVWKSPVTVSGARVYWFDDTGRGACRLPVSWQILYRDGGDWKPVEGVSAWPVKPDAWCEVEFRPVTTTALRISVRMQPEWAAGVHEWKVLTPDD